MKKVLLFALGIMFGFSTLAQNVIYQDDFESFTTGDYLALQSDDWTTWSNAPGTAEDAIISEDFASSPVKSVLVEGTNDLVKGLGDKTSGVYEISFDFYVPSGFGGYYNLQHFEAPGIEWALEVYFGSDGNGEVHGGGTSAATFTYNLDNWFEIVNIVDLNADWAELYIDGNLIHEWQFSLTSQGNPGTLQLGGVNIYAGAPTGDTPKFYFDDFYYAEVPNTLFSDDMESYDLDYLALQSEWWDTWSGAPGTDEDALVVDEQAHSGTQSAKVDGVVDLIGSFDDKVSGKYQVNFWMYVPDGYTGYYNFQHYATPGVEWAGEFWFENGGNGTVDAGGTAAATFAFTHDMWFQVKHEIDLDSDWAKFWVDDMLVHEWQWSLTAQGAQGANQLGGIDLYAGANAPDDPLYYFDDFEWIELSSSTDPGIAVDPAMFEEVVEPGGSSTQVLTIENTGSAELEYDIDVIYEFTSDNKSTPAEGRTAHNTKSVVLDLNYASTPTNGGAPAPSDDVTLNYDGDNFSAVGLNNPGPWEVAARFQNDVTVLYAGMDLTSIEVFINDDVTYYEARVYGEGSYYEPGETYVEQSWTGLGYQWNTIVLDEPVKITGEELWVGYYITQQIGGIFPCGTDQGPPHEYGDWIKSGIAWNKLSVNNPELLYNWNIRAHLTGEAIYQWLSVTGPNGTVAVGETAEVDVNFDATNLEIGTYMANLQINNNDPLNDKLLVPVTLDVLVGINEAGENVAVMVYPNPSNSYVNIEANETIKSVKVFNYVGQAVDMIRVNAEQTQLNTSNYQTGIYILQIETENGFMTRQLQVR